LAARLRSSWATDDLKLDHRRNCVVQRHSAPILRAGHPRRIGRRCRKIERQQGQITKEKDTRLALTLLFGPRRYESTDFSQSKTAEVEGGEAIGGLKMAKSGNNGTDGRQDCGTGGGRAGTGGEAGKRSGRRAGEGASRGTRDLARSHCATLHSLSSLESRPWHGRPLCGSSWGGAWRGFAASLAPVCWRGARLAGSLGWCFTLCYP